MIPFPTLDCTRLTMPARWLLVLCVSIGASLAASESIPRQYAMVERHWPATVDRSVNPFDPDSIRLDAMVTPPGGKTFSVPLFYNHPCKRGRNTDGHETVEPTGAPRWSLRFTPRESGTYSVRVERQMRGGPSTELDRFALTVDRAAKGARGFIRVNPDVPSRFIFDNGEGYFALGHNVCWVKKENGTYGFDRYFKRMAEAGENYSRVWLCSWGIDLDTKRAYEINLLNAWRLDHVFAEASRRGIYLKLCIDNFYDQRYHWDRSPFNAANGGPCDTRLDRFLSPEAERLSRARLRYLVARYSAYTSLLAYEFWNEMDYAIGSLELAEAGLSAYNVDDSVYIPWTVRSARWLRALDPHKHLITTSLGMHTYWPSLWRDPSIDIVQYHSYIHYMDALRSSEEEDAAAFALTGIRAIGGNGKPALLSEYGYMGEDSHSSMNPGDPQGIALHNALWAGAHSGVSGTPMFWWWDNYIEPNDLYFRYRSLATYLNDVDWTLDFTPMRAEDTGARVLALRSDSLTLLWIQNRRSTWYEQLRRHRRPEQFSNVNLALDGFLPGTYRVNWYDPQGGRALSSEDLKSTDGSLRLRVPTFRHDIAAKLRLVRK